MLKPPHPGETIKEDYLVPLGMSVNGNARNSVESCDSRVTHSTTPFSA